jgi:hypothetical protein
MMTGYEAFCLYQAIKLHFTSEKYDFFRYNGKMHISVTSFENRKDKYHFYKLSRKFTNKDELTQFIVANFVEDDKVWVGSLLTAEAESIYRKHQKYIQSVSYIFENECRKVFGDVKDPNEVLKVHGGEYPILLKKYLQKDIEPETLCLLDRLLNFTPVWAKQIADTIVWPNHRLKLTKFAAFLPKDDVKYKLILKKVLND